MVAKLFPGAGRECLPFGHCEVGFGNCGARVCELGLNDLLRLGEDVPDDEGFLCPG